jgi:hypothetical protein
VSDAVTGERRAPRTQHANQKAAYNLQPYHLLSLHLHAEETLLADGLEMERAGEKIVSPDNPLFVSIQLWQV